MEAPKYLRFSAAAIDEKNSVPISFHMTPF